MPDEHPQGWWIDVEQPSNNNWIMLRAVGRGIVMTGFGVTLLMAWGVGSRPWVLGTSWNSQVWKRGKIGFNQPLIYIHPLPLAKIFYSPLFISVAKNVFLSINILGGGHLPPPSPYYAYDGRYCRAWLFRDVCSFGATNDDGCTRKSQGSSDHLHDTRGKGSLLPIVTVYETGVYHFDPESMLQ